MIQQYVLTVQKVNCILCGQQVEGGDSAPLLCPGAMPPGVLHPGLEPSAQERHGPVGAGPEEGHENNEGAGTPLLCGNSERVGAVQPGGEKAPRTPYSSLSVVPEGDLQASWRGTFYKSL